MMWFSKASPLMLPIDERLDLRPSLCKVVYSMGKALCLLLSASGLLFSASVLFDLYSFLQGFLPDWEHFCILGIAVVYVSSLIVLSITGYFILMMLVEKVDVLLWRYVVRRKIFSYPVIEQTGLEDSPFVENREEIISDHDQTERARRALVRTGQYRV